MYRVFDRLLKAVLGASFVVSLTATAGLAQTPPSGTPAPGAAGAPAASGAPAAPAWKDQAEYDAAQAAQKETDPNKKLDLLKAWQDKYPDSAFKSQRLLAFMNTWSQLAAKALTSNDPAALAAAKTAAQSLLDNLDAAFDPANKPPTVPDDQWKAARGQVEQQAHITLGYIALQNKDYPAAEAEFKKVVVLNDQNAQVAYWLGTAIASQKKIERTPEALYQFARATAITGPGALNATGKTTADTYLTKAYNGYHGEDVKGLQDLKDAAAKSALPPDGWPGIESVVDIEKKKLGSEQAYLDAHPDIKLWRDLKATLTAPDGDDYFTKSMKGSIIPKTFNAKVISWTPDPNPTEIKISIDDPQGDAVIKFEKPIHAKLDAGTAITIEGYAESYAKDPFTITFKGEESKITGLPVDAPKKPPVRRKRPAA